MTVGPRRRTSRRSGQASRRRGSCTSRDLNPNAPRGTTTSRWRVYHSARRALRREEQSKPTPCGAIPLARGSPASGVHSPCPVRGDVCTNPGSNRRHPRCKRGALPAELSVRTRMAFAILAWWSREVLTLRPPASHAGALPLSYRTVCTPRLGTGALPPTRLSGHSELVELADREWRAGAAELRSPARMTDRFPRSRAHADLEEWS